MNLLICQTDKHEMKMIICDCPRSYTLVIDVAIVSIYCQFPENSHILAFCPPTLQQITNATCALNERLLTGLQS